MRSISQIAFKLFAVKTSSILLLIFFVSIGECLSLPKYKPEIPPVKLVDGRLIYQIDSFGNRIPDYSYCGYYASERAIPFVQTKVIVPLTDGDATDIIQNAIDYVAQLPLQENGFRGAIQFKPGTYNIEGRFIISVSGIVFRGAGFGSIGTTLKANGIDRETLFQVQGGESIVEQSKIEITTPYVPVNSVSFEVVSTDNLKVNDRIFITRPATEEWVESLGMKNFGGETDWLGWRAGYLNIVWDRKIIAIKGDEITIDAPITTALDHKMGGGYLNSYSWKKRVANVGLENLRLESDFDDNNLKDEEHCWNAISFENARNCWVRQINFSHFAGSAVAAYETSSLITVEDCIAEEPVSEIAAYRRNSFFTAGQQNLFQRCYAEFGWHDFSTGFCAAGPNAFVQCESHLPNNFSGAADSWASGVLFDIVNVDGHKLSFVNRGQDAQGAGWTAANSMFWQCSASKIECFEPKGANNWAFGAWAQFAGNGYWYEANSHIKPRSLFYQQLSDRIGAGNIPDNPIIEYSTNPTSSPTIEMAAEIVEFYTNNQVQTVKEFILDAPQRNRIQSDFSEKAKLATKLERNKNIDTKPEHTIAILNGWLVSEGFVLTGSRASSPWWSSTIRPRGIERSSMAVTRFVPGKQGKGYTDKLEDVIAEMKQKNVVAYEQNYALWYERRRDDHERIRRMDGDVWAPFYELPFARTGEGLAWDGLSKYDLTKYNSWYWNRLKTFANLAENSGRVLIHQNYFQHNIIEAGAHWVDSPWRTVNNINNTGFSEPPPFAGDKRIFIAHEFYDVEHPVRRELHRKYILQCLNNFADNSCVINTTSAEYTGPLHFVEFWLDVVAEWEAETGKEAKIALSTTKDVQDAILSDPVRSKIVDIIDIRYWSYREDGSLYAPPGGKNLAPRQHARQVKPGKRSFEQVYKTVSEYRMQFPEKAVLYSEGNYNSFGWAVFMAGGSLPVLNISLPNDLLSAASNFVPVGNRKNQENQWILENKGEGMIIYSKSNKTIEVDLNKYKGEFLARFINPATGEWLEKQDSINGGKIEKIEIPKSGDVVLWISKK